jgi:adenylate cyclase
MALEIERKHLVTSDNWRGAVISTQRLRQGYLAGTDPLTVRVRIADGQATLAFKSPRVGAVREDIEFPVPLGEAERLLEVCRRRTVEKLRHRVAAHGMTWLVDEFVSPVAGLVLAEIELEHPDQPYILPDWAGAEVTSDPRYSNSRLARLSRGRAPPSPEEAPRQRAAPGGGGDQQDARHDAPRKGRAPGRRGQDHLRHTV